MNKHGEVIGYILQQKELGKTSEQIQDDLIDQGFNTVYVSSTLNSIRWD